MHYLLPEFRRRKLRRRGGLTFRRGEQELEQVFFTQVTVVASRSLAIARTPETHRPPILLQTPGSGPHDSAPITIFRVCQAPTPLDRDQRAIRRLRVPVD